MMMIPSFVVLLSCLYLNPQVLFFVHSPCRLSAGGGAGASEQLSDPTSWWVAAWRLADG